MSVDPSFSFDLYPGLDAELTAAYERNIAAGTASPEAVANSGLAAAIAQNLPNKQSILGEDISPVFKEKFYTALEAAEGLYEGLSVIVPEANTTQFNNINWEHLARHYEAMQLHDLQPEVVVTLNGQSLEDWKQHYARLPGTKDGGLYVYDEVAAAWAELNPPEEAGWTVSVIASAPEPAIKDISHDLNNMEDGDRSKLDSVFADTLSVNGVLSIRGRYPTLSEYLTLQAQRLNAGEPPIDPETSTWLKGEFDSGTKAPCADWYPDDGRVRVLWLEPGGRGDRLGVRPAVRG